MNKWTSSFRQKYGLQCCPAEGIIYYLYTACAWPRRQGKTKLQCICIFHEMPDLSVLTTLQPLQIGVRNSTEQLRVSVMLTVMSLPRRKEACARHREALLTSSAAAAAEAPLPCHGALPWPLACPAMHGTPGPAPPAQSTATACMRSAVFQRICSALASNAMH